MINDDKGSSQRSALSSLLDGSSPLSVDLLRHLVFMWGINLELDFECPFFNLSHVIRMRDLMSWLSPCDSSNKWVEGAVGWLHLGPQTGG